MKQKGESRFSPAVAIVAVLWLTYPVVFDALHDGLLNDMAAAYVVLPAFVSIWVLGLRAASLVAFLMLPMHMVLYRLNGHDGGWDLFGGVAGFFGLTTLALGSAAFGFAVERLRRTESHLAATDRHVSVVAHELRNPLAGVLGLAQTLVDTWDDLDPDEARTLAGMIASEARTLSAIVSDLLDAGRARHKALHVVAETVDLGELVRGAADEPRVTGNPIAWADPLRVGQIVRNLLANAEAHGRPPVEVAVWANDAEAFVEVSDTGDGVPAEVERKLFDPFVSAGGQGSTGLGLWLSRALAEAMNGSLDYARTGGVTRFRLTLPGRPTGNTPGDPRDLVRGSNRPD